MNIFNTSFKMDKLSELLRKLDIVGVQLSDSENSDDLCKRLVTDKGSLDQIIKSIHSKQATIALEAVAEIAKNESTRLPLVENNCIPAIIDQVYSEETDVRIQCCRALANICFDNDVGRKAVLSHKGVSAILELLKNEMNDTSQNETSSRLLLVSVGCLHNITNSNEEMQSLALSGNAMTLMQRCIEGNAEDCVLMGMVLLVLHDLTDTDQGRKEFLDLNFLSVFNDKLLHSDLHNEELVRDALELLVFLADDAIAESNVPQRLLKMVETCEMEHDVNNDPILKVIGDLMVAILTGEKAMPLLYDDGNGPLYEATKRWLTSSYMHLRTYGCLAIGNFARSDAHSVALVSQGVAKPLVQHVSKQEQDVVLLHAALCALRNLSIASANKDVLHDEGLVAAILTHTGATMPAVQFKLLGCLRMLVDNKESVAVSLGLNRTLLETVSEWSKCEDHAGVKGESQRLLAWIAKHSRGRVDVVSAMVSCGSLRPLVDMLSSPHQLMQHEGILALSFVAAQKLEESQSQLVDLDVIAALKVLVTESDTASEIKSNALNFTCSLLRSEPLLMQINAAEFGELAQEMSQSDDPVLKTAAHNLYSKLQLA